MQSQVDSMCALAVNWTEFKPLPPTCKKFSLVLTTDGFQPNAIPYLQLDTSEPDAIAQIFSFVTQQTFSVFASTWMRALPDQMDNPFGSAIYAFYIPRSFLERKLKLFMLIKDEVKPTAHSMPDEVCGFTDVLDEQLKKILL
jgi:hypothetical protein